MRFQRDGFGRGHVVESINPGFPSGKHNQEEKGIPHLRPMNISIKGEIDLSEVKYVEVTKYNSLSNGDILFNNTNSPALVGKTAIIEKDANWAYSNHMTRIRLSKDMLNPKYISNSIHYLFYTGFFKMNCTNHVNQASINKTFLTDRVFIPLPPLPEQHRIVDKIEELFTKLDAGIESLKKVQAQLKHYRQAVLKSAVEGKLTAEWRTMHKDELEPASVLLERIRKEKSKDAKYAGSLIDDDKQDTMADLPDLPDGWVWARLDNISDALGGYAFKSGDYKENGYQIVKIGNVKMGYLAINEKPSFVQNVEKKIIEKYLLKRNDILITLTGTRRKRDYGFVAMVKDESNLLLNQRVARLRFHQSLSSKFFLIALQSRNFRDRFFRNETGNVGQGNVGMKAIRDEFVMLPTAAEQQKIAEEVDLHLSIADEVGSVINAELKRAERLRQSILKQAFSGKLVPQDSNDEPASVLLERIKQEKEKNDNQKKNQKGNARQMKLL